MIRRNVVGVILVLSVILTIAIRWVGLSGENYRSIISSDGRGYYQYYESALGEGSLNKQKANGTYLVYTPDSMVVNKYFVGLPILWSPFVMPVYAYYSIASNSEIDFYAEGFQKAISIAALFYLFLGLFALKKLLLSFGIERRILNITLFAFFFGTNLSYYTIIEPSMSHVYSFALISGFLYFVRLYSLKLLPQYLIYSSLVFAFIVLLRPVNGLILFAIPIVWDGRIPFLETLKSHIELIIAAVFLAIMIVMIQPIFWYLQTDSWLQWSYAGEGFYFSHPHMLDFILSFRKGFLIYTPLLLISLFGIVMIGIKDKKQSLKFIGFLVLTIYILSSWWNWYYGDSYGSRALIDYYPLFILAFALGLQNTGNRIKLGIVISSMFFIFLNLFQSYQYYHNIMSHYDMNYEKYAYIFGKYGEEYENSLGGNDDIVPFHKKTMKPLFEVNSLYSPYYRVSCNTISFDNDKIASITKGKELPCSIVFNSDRLIGYKALYAEMRCATINKGAALTDVFWTIKLYSKSQQTHYYAFRINDVPITVDSYRNDIYRFTLPVPKLKSDEIVIGLWNKGRRDFEIKDVQIKVFGILE